MKCPRCGLNNLDHINFCVKCGLQLVAVTLPDDFTPEAPRAGKLQFFRKLFWRWRRSRQIVLPEDGPGTRQSAWKNLSNLLAFDTLEPVPNGVVAMILSFFLPGLGQIFLGRKRRGIAFLLITLLALFIFWMGIRYFNNSSINSAITLFLIVQSCAVFDALPRIQVNSVGGWIRNLTFMLGIWIGCYICINLGGNATVNYFWDGRRLMVINFGQPQESIIRFGDTILAGTQETYERGNLVEYTHEMPYLYGRSLRWQNIVAMDRVIGLPGETVSVKNGIISINSVPLKNQDGLTFYKMTIPNMEIKLGSNEYFIFNSRQRGQLVPYMPRRRDCTVINLNNIRCRLIRIVSPTDRIREL